MRFKWSLIFIAGAIFSGIFGFWGTGGIAAEIAKILFFVFLVLFAISLIFDHPSTRL